MDALVAISVVSRPFEVFPEVAASPRHLFVPVAEGLELLDRLHGVGYVFEGMKKFERGDERLI
ncbi:MAG: hypothetical protein OXI87_13315 [Albidovulum sp.]|nr:hypothetical protein [Albidovulum sp.]